MRGRKVCTLLLILCISISFCGWGNPKKVMLDTELNHIYLSETAEFVITNFTQDHASAVEKYQNQFVRLSGRVVSVDKKGSTLKIAGNNSNEKLIICSCPKAFQEQVKSIKPEDNVVVYGKLTVDRFDKDIRINVDNVTSSKTIGHSLPGLYFAKDGSRQNMNALLQNSLNNGKVKFYVPSGWNEVESKISGDLGTIEGFQYSLNHLTGSSNIYPEMFFVSYFDNSKFLADVVDSAKTSEIEKAIIRNISGEEPTKFPIKEIKTYYGTKYTYYQTTYKDTRMDFKGDGYHVEYVFQPDGDQGIVMYLYVYKEAHHLSDIMFLLRFLSIAG